MSDEETPLQVTSDSLLTTEYRDGQLQIVEVAQYGKEGEKQVLATTSETQILPDLDGEEIAESRYVQVLNADKSVVQLDLLNMTLVRCEDGSDTTYKLVANTEAPAGTEIPSDATLTCVLQSDDQEGEDTDNQDTYVVMNGGEEGPLVFLKSDFQDGSVEVVKHGEEKETTRKPSPTEILERAKALQKKAQLLQNAKPVDRRRGRKLKTDFPAPHELLASPNFKLFLYSCKMCPFKCNAIKEMTQHKGCLACISNSQLKTDFPVPPELLASPNFKQFLYSCKMCTYKCNALKEMTQHKAEEHSSGARARAGRAGAPLQCARCPYKGTSHAQLMRHVQEQHLRSDDEQINVVNLNSKDVDEAQILVCGACGFECSTKLDFKKHIKKEHGATVVTMSV